MGTLVGVSLDGHSIPNRVDVLVMLGPSKPLNDRALYTLDQFLVRGGTLLLFSTTDHKVGNSRITMATAPGLGKLLLKYGQGRRRSDR